MDILYCNVLCDGMSEVRSAFHSLKERFQGEDGRDVRMVAFRDNFVVSQGQKCCEAVLSVHGYMVTVVLLDASLARLEKQLGNMSKIACNIGLLNEVRPQKWETITSAAETITRTRRPQHCLLCGFAMCLRIFAFYTALTFSRNLYP